MYSRFTVLFIIARLLACAKILRKFPTTIAGFTMFLGVSDAWFINPVAYSDRCRGDDLGQCFKYTYDGLTCDDTSPKCTKHHKINDLVENAR